MKDRPGVLAPPPLIYAVFFALGWFTRGLWPFALPRGVKVAGAGLIAAGLALAIVAWFTMRAAGTNVDPYQPALALVTGGPFARTRNPFYLSLTIIYTGAALLFNVVMALALLPLLLLVMHVAVIRLEERYLESKFADACRVYRSSVRRWI